AKEIEGLISESVALIDRGSSEVVNAGDTMKGIVEAVKRLTDIMLEIAAASDEQRQGIEQVAQAIAEMDNVTQQNASLVEEASAAAVS
ncbi:methyl-accepting chemotaxis protein, partial [Cronobacter sakazakii]